MRLSHPLRLFASAFLAIAVIVIAPAGAYSGLVVKSPGGIVQLAQRKGTRGYQGVPSQYSTPNRLESCMETWDRATHISKTRWREICKQQIKDIDKDIESTSDR